MSWPPRYFSPTCYPPRYFPPGWLDTGTGLVGFDEPEIPSRGEVSDLRLYTHVVMIPVMHIPQQTTASWEYDTGEQHPFDEEHRMEHYFDNPPTISEPMALTLRVRTVLEHPESRVSVVLARESPADEGAWLSQPLFEAAGECSLENEQETTLTIPMAWWNDFYSGAEQGLIWVRPVIGPDQACVVSMCHVRLSAPIYSGDAGASSHCGVRWRSYEKHRLHDGTLDYLWGELKWDDYFGTMVVEVNSPVMAGDGEGRKLSYGGLAVSPEDTEGHPGEGATATLVPYQRRGCVVRFAGVGDCSLSQVP